MQIRLVCGTGAHGLSALARIVTLPPKRSQRLHQCGDVFGRRKGRRYPQMPADHTDGTRGSLLRSAQSVPICGPNSPRQGRRTQATSLPPEAWGPRRHCATPHPIGLERSAKELRLLHARRAAFAKWVSNGASRAARQRLRRRLRLRLRHRPRKVHGLRAAFPE